MWDYSGSIPAEEYYQPDTMQPAKRAEFKIWYAEQLRNEVRFDFQEEMISYCHSDVKLVLRFVYEFAENRWYLHWSRSVSMHYGGIETTKHYDFQYANHMAQ